MSDWYPGTRDGALNMGKVWMTVMAKNAAAWGIPTEEIAGLADVVNTADRTASITAKYKAAFDSRSGYGYKIYYGVMPPGGATVEQATGRTRLLMKVPAAGDDLPFSVWTRRRKETMDFHEDRGSTVYFCIRYENAKGESGPWGVVFSAIVP